MAAITTEMALPSIAEDRVRDALATLGTVATVEVSALPAVTLLFGNVESAAIRMSSATLDADTMEEMLDRFGDVEALDAEIDSLQAGPFDVESVSLTKRGQSLDKAAEADQGFNQDVFVQALRAHRRTRDADFPEIGTPIEDIRSYFDAWADELDGS